MMKILSKDTYLKALGLYTLATDQYRQMRQTEFALNNLLHGDGDYQGEVSDAIYNDKHSVADLLAALKQEDIKVAKP